MIDLSLQEKPPALGRLPHRPLGTFASPDSNDERARDLACDGLGPSLESVGFEAAPILQFIAGPADLNQTPTFAVACEYRVEVFNTGPPSN